ncbi:MAG: hypothetical protein HON90_06895 [Halobacteriovoraceae bacterium]|jgi:hypothetical protein|nr:hypothetical protein [Halobacteriovoraceae bacterium]
MREINNTIYEMLKMDEPDDGISINQIITDDLIQKSEDGEIKAEIGASKLLDKKADELYAEDKKSTLKSVKASGTRTNLKTPAELNEKPKAPRIPGAPTVKKKAVPATPGTGKRKVVAKKPAAAGSSAKKKVVRKKVSKKVTKKVVKKPAAKTTNPMLYVLILVLVGAGAYYYLNMM